jgi:DNA polymerase-3 subunit beta
MNIEINLNVLKAVNEYAGKEQTRHYLHGVCLQVGDGSLTYIATNGLVLLAHRDETKADWTGEIIIPADIIKAIKIGKRDNHVAMLERGDYPRGRIDMDKCTLHYNGVAVTFSPIDGTFPNWRRVIPSEVDGVTAQFNGELLAKYVKTSKTLYDGTIPTVHHNGLSAACVTFPDDKTVGAVMPMKHCGTKLPGWVQEPLEAVVS